MKYLVVSDNHGDRQILVDIKNQNMGKVDYFLHCGDSELDPNDELWQTYLSVKGNCDYYPEYPESRIVKTPLDTIYMTHGHLANVRFGLTQLSLQAGQAHANIALFGHTHQLGCEMEQGVLYLNPGSISQPRGPIQIPAYAIIESTEDSLTVQYYRRIHEPLKDYRFSYKK